MAERDHIEKLVAAINGAWTNDQTEDLNGLFHEDIVITDARSQHRAQGREACVKSYEDFVRSARVLSFEVFDLRIDIWGSTAAADYRFDIEYEMAGDDYQESGRDIFIFAREDGRWLAVWRLLSAD